MFLLISPKAQNTSIISSEKADFALLMSTRPSVSTSENHNLTIPTQKVPKQAMESNNNKTEKAVSPTSAQAIEKPIAKTASTEKITKENFCVVVASAIPESNAKIFVSNLHKEGFTDATIYKKGKMVRVVFSGFATEAEAYQKLKSLRQRSDRFNSAWVLSTK